MAQYPCGKRSVERRSYLNLARGVINELKVLQLSKLLDKSPNLSAAAAIAARRCGGVKLADVELYGVKSLLFRLEVGVACKAKVRKAQEILHVGFARILMIGIIGVLPKIAG